MKNSLVLILAILFTINAFPQQETDSSKQHYQSLSHFFQQGKFSIHTRTFFMGTLNQGYLKDDYALATGAGIGYRSAAFKGFGFGLNGFFIFNVKSSNLTAPDVSTGQLNRYEIGLFDVTHPENKHDLDRLEEAYLYYQRPQWELTVGRMNINTPFINGQDGRMRPSLEEGIFITGKAGKRITYLGGWLWAMSPRSTVRWYGVAESIGLYPAGVNTLGKKSGYPGNLSSKGIALAGLRYKWQRIDSELWCTVIENISSTTFAQNEVSINNKLKAGLQYVRQDRINHGGNDSPMLTYMTNKSAQLVAGRLEYRSGRSSVNLNYSLMSNEGRFTFPREWGREPFYTFIPRERSEGTSGVQAITANFQQKSFPANNMSVSLAMGYFNLPSPANFTENKYGLGSYSQANLQLRYKPTQLLSGLQVTTLLMAKLNHSGLLPDKYLYNRSNILHGEVVIDYLFSGGNQK